jgi:hypothetical protein
MKNINNGYKQFEVTFTTNTNKYNNITRTVGISALNNYHAEMLCHQTFGSFNKVHPVLVTSNRIKVDSCTEVKEVKEDERELVEV